MPFQFPEKSLRCNVNRMNAWLKSAVNKVQATDWKDETLPNPSIAGTQLFRLRESLFCGEIALRYRNYEKAKLRRFFLY